MLTIKEKKAHTQIKKIIVVWCTPSTYIHSINFTWEFLLYSLRIELIILTGFTNNPLASPGYQSKPLQHL